MDRTKLKANGVQPFVWSAVDADTRNSSQRVLATRRHPAKGIDGGVLQVIKGKDAEVLQ